LKAPDLLGFVQFHCKPCARDYLVPPTSPAELTLHAIARELEYAYGGAGQMPAFELQIYNKACEALNITEPQEAR